MIFKLLFPIVLIIVIVWMVKGRKSVPEGQVVADPLTGKQKLAMWVLCFMNPVLSGAVFYYGWKNKLPTKAKQANQISLWAFFILILLGIASFVLVGLNEERMKSEAKNINQQALMSESDFDTAFEGKSYSEAIAYCDTLNSANKDYCLLSLAAQAALTGENTANIEVEICPKVSDKARVVCYVVLDRCDSIKNEETKNICKSKVEKKDQYIKEETQTEN